MATRRRRHRDGTWRVGQVGAPPVYWCPAATFRLAGALGTPATTTTHSLAFPPFRGGLFLKDLVFHVSYTLQGQKLENLPLYVF